MSDTRLTVQSLFENGKCVHGLLLNACNELRSSSDSLVVISLDSYGFGHIFAGYLSGILSAGCVLPSTRAYPTSTHFHIKFRIGGTKKDLFLPKRHLAGARSVVVADEWLLAANLPRLRAVVDALEELGLRVSSIVTLFATFDVGPLVKGCPVIQCWKKSLPAPVLEPQVFEGSLSTSSAHHPGNKNTSEPNKRRRVEQTAGRPKTPSPLPYTTFKERLEEASLENSTASPTPPFRSESPSTPPSRSPRNTNAPSSSPPKDTKTTPSKPLAHPVVVEAEQEQLPPQERNEEEPSSKPAEIRVSPGVHTSVFRANVQMEDTSVSAYFRHSGRRAAVIVTKLE